jgi:hypothetical protein
MLQLWSKIPSRERLGLLQRHFNFLKNRTDYVKPPVKGSILTPDVPSIPCRSISPNFYTATSATTFRFWSSFTVFKVAGGAGWWKRSRPLFPSLFGLFQLVTSYRVLRLALGSHSQWRKQCFACSG